MKRIIIIFFSLLICQISICQTVDAFKDLIEQKENGVFKFYLTNNFTLVKSECADYFMECKLSKNKFVFEDTLKIYYKNGTSYITANYSNGLKEGNFTWYHKNGKVSCQGIYKLDKRNGVWKYYHENGNLKKVIDYTGEFPLLTEAYNKKGKQMVENGKGHYEDEVLTPSVLGLAKVEGDISDGTLDGEWKIYKGTNLFFKESFVDKQFFKGISYSQLGQKTYTDRFFSSYLDEIPLESINLTSPKTKCNLIGTRVSVNLKNDFSAILKSNYPKTDLNNISKNFWVFAGIEFDKNENIKSVMVFSNSEELNKNKLADFVRRSYTSSNKANESRDNRLFFPLVVIDGKLYLSGDSEVKLLNK